MELKLAAMDMGSFYHRVLCQTFRQMQQEQLSWSELSNEKIDHLVGGVTAIRTSGHWRASWEVPRLGDRH